MLVARVVRQVMHVCLAEWRHRLSQSILTRVSSEEARICEYLGE